MNLPVLIVGAGPAGLMMACELARHGISFRIIDKKPEATTTSNASFIQTRTLEIFDHLTIAKDFFKLGNPCHAINLYEKGESLIKFSLQDINSIYPFILMLPQSQTENLLNKNLEKWHIKVERAVELKDLKQNENDITSTVVHADGRIEEIVSQWLIACDGWNSTVRQKLNVPFPGEDFKEQFILADAEIDSFKEKDEVHIFFDSGSVFAAFPLKENTYRIIANLHLDVKRKTYYPKEVIDMAQERAYGAYYIKNVSWISSFWIHSRIIESLRKDNIFFVGDAAHVLSPVAGQGMNMGIQDAYNLAWKLALVIHGKAKHTLLDTYNKERLPVISEIVKQTDNITRMCLDEKSFLSQLRKFARKISGSKGQYVKKLGNELTQLNIKYQQSPIIDYDEKNHNAPQPGERAPNVRINEAETLYRYFNNTQHNVLLFTGTNPNKRQYDQMKDLQKIMNETYPGLVKTYIVSRDLIQAENLIEDKKSELHLAYQAKNPTMIVVRPDTYIAYRSTHFDASTLHEFFDRYFKLTVTH